MNERIGFVGLGLMGTGFTKRLIATGHTVTGFDADPARREEAAKNGVRIAVSATEVAQASDIILVCVINTAAVEDVVLGRAALLRRATLPARSVVDHSTTEIKATLAPRGTTRKARHATFVDAPVSGGPGAAETGTLAIMAGGMMLRLPASGRSWRTRQPRAWAAVGAGQATKLVNQALVLTNYCVLAEALRLARGLRRRYAQDPAGAGTGSRGLEPDAGAVCRG